MNMSDSTGFNIAELINTSAVKEGGDTQELKVEKLVGKLRRLHEGKRFLEEEIKGIQSLSEALQKDLATLQFEASELEGDQKEKQELCRKLKFQFDESKQDSTRQLEHNKQSEELFEQYKCEIQGIKLKQRKQCMKFENQLHLLTEQHKNLHSVFSQDRLPDEIRSAENTNSQLLLAVQKKYAHLNSLHEELEEVKKQNQQRTLPAGTDVEQNAQYSEGKVL